MSRNRIKDFREKKKLTQKQLADKFNIFLTQKHKKEISSATLARWERGENKPSTEYLKLLADFFKVPPKYINGAFNEWELLQIIKKEYEHQIKTPPQSVGWYKNNTPLAYYCDLYLYIVGDFNHIDLKFSLDDNTKEKNIFKNSAFNVDENSALIPPNPNNNKIIGNLENANIYEWGYFFILLFSSRYSIYLDLLVNGNVEYREEWLINSFIQALKVSLLNYSSIFGNRDFENRQDIEEEYNKFFNYNDDLPF